MDLNQLPTEERLDQLRRCAASMRKAMEHALAEQLEEEVQRGLGFRKLFLQAYEQGFSEGKDEASRVVQMTLACKNVDQDSSGWYALHVDKANGCKETVGRGATAWDAVRNAHAR